MMKEWSAGALAQATEGIEQLCEKSAAWEWNMVSHKWNWTSPRLGQDENKMDVWCQRLQASQQ